MRYRQKTALALASLLVLAAACQKAGDGAIEKTNDEVKKKPKDKDDDPPATAAPKKHRAAAEPCPRETKIMKLAAKMATPPGPPCKANADCKDEKNGRCSA